MFMGMDLGFRGKVVRWWFRRLIRQTRLSDRFIMRLKRRKLEQVRVYSNDSMPSQWLLLAFICFLPN
jgi:hypothetical protein